MINDKCPGDNPPPPQSNTERRIMISNPHSPKIPSHLCLMLIFIPNRFQTETGGTAGHHSFTFSLLLEINYVLPLSHCHTFFKERE